MWYGFKNIKWKNEVFNLKLRNKLKTRSLNLNINLKINFKKNFIFFYLPFNWEGIFLKVNKKKKFLILYLYSYFYFFYLPVSNFFFNFFYDVNTKVFTFKYLLINNFFFLYWSIFKNIFYSFSKFFFKKLKFKGKGYYIYKGKRNTIATQFGYSHMTRIYGFTIFLKFITKTIIFMYGVNRTDILKMSQSLFLKRPINIFTGKGVRFSKQIIYKKTGKISSYR